MSVKKYSKFAGNNIDPEIRKHIGFGNNEFEFFPSKVQNRFLDKATEDGLNKANIANNKLYGSCSTYDSAIDEFYGIAADAYMDIYLMVVVGVWRI
jgi:hypothetical protein